MSLTLLFAVAILPAVVAYLIAVFRDPLRYAMPPYLVSLPFSSLFSVGSGPFSSASSMLGALLGVALLVQLATTRRGSPRLSAAVPLWVIFLALCGLSFFWSVAPTATLNGVLVLASLVILYVALALTHFDRTTLRRFENSVVLGGVLVVGYGLAQLLLLGGLPETDGGTARFGNDLLDPNNQAASLLLPLAITAWRTLHADSPSRRWVFAGASLVLFLGIAMTGSRGGFLAAVVVFATVVLFSTARRTLKLALALAAVLFLTVLLVVQPGGVGTRQLERDTSSGRVDIWNVALNSCPEYCLAGAGWGGFPEVYKEQLAATPEAKVQLGGVAYQPHNIFLLALVEAGVLGLVLMALALGIALVSAVRLPDSLRGPPAAALLGNLVSSFLLSNLEYKFFWAVLAYVVISQSVAQSEEDSPHGPLAHPRLTNAGV